MHTLSIFRQSFSVIRVMSRCKCCIIIVIAVDEGRDGLPMLWKRKHHSDIFARTFLYYYDPANSGDFPILGCRRCQQLNET